MTTRREGDIKGEYNKYVKEKMKILIKTNILPLNDFGGMITFRKEDD